MTEPAAVVGLEFADLELWPDCVVTVFKSDGLDVPAAPNGVETILDTAAHEWAHHALAQVRHARPSVCLRGVVEGHGRKWTDEKHEEETEAYALGLLLAQFLREVLKAYGRKEA